MFVTLLLLMLKVWVVHLFILIIYFSLLRRTKKCDDDPNNSDGTSQKQIFDGYGSIIINEICKVQYLNSYNWKSYQIISKEGRTTSIDGKYLKSRSKYTLIP